MDHIQVAMKNAIEAISTLGRIQAEIDDCRRAEIAAQKKLNESSKDLAQWLHLLPGRNRVILHEGKVYDLEVTANGASLTRIESVTV